MFVGEPLVVVIVGQLLDSDCCDEHFDMNTDCWDQHSDKSTDSFGWFATKIEMDIDCFPDAGIGYYLGAVLGYVFVVGNCYFLG